MQYASLYQGGIMESKNVLMSKTIWVNFLVALGAILSNWVPALAEILSEANLLLIFSVVNLVLRSVTKDAIEFK